LSSVTNNTKDKTGEALDLPLLWRIVKLAKPYKTYGILAALTTLILAVIVPAQPIIIQRTIDNYVAIGDLEGLNFMLIILLSILVFQTIIMFFNTYLTNWLGQMVVNDLRMTVYNHLTRLRVKFYDKTAIGTMVTRSVSDVETIASIFSQGVITISGDLLQLLVITIVMFVTDWKLSLICLSVLPLLFYASNQFRKGVKSAFQQVRTQISRLNSFVQEHISGMGVVQIFNRQDVEYEKFKKINYLHFQANKKAVFHYAIFFPIVEIITATSIGMLIWYGSKNAVDGSVSPGTIVAFILYLNMFFRPLRLIADRFNTIQMGMVASERIFKLIDDHTHDEVGGKFAEEIKGSVQFSKVNFGYNVNELVLKDISFDVPVGKTLAIVGSTGSGKSTIVNLLTNFYPIENGSIQVDGVEISDWDLASLRGQLAFVLQDVFLFSGSIRDNIKLLKPQITDEEMIAASKEIGAHRFISGLEGRYDFNVMERGSSLSVGQRQLISFVRALVFNPRILILDEATSSVDSETESLIQDAISKLMKNRTSIVIAHRLSTIRNADQIMVLGKGRILEKGSHHDLMVKNGVYADMLEKQQLSIVD
jgi:ATP-binding cassette subfamily B multidrug efflux pump